MHVMHMNKILIRKDEKLKILRSSYRQRDVQSTHMNNN